METNLPATTGAADVPALFDPDLMALGFEGFLAGPPPLKNITLLNSTKQCADRKLTPQDQGKFYDEATGELHASLTLVLMKINTSKSWQDKYDPKAKEQKVYCYSSDGVKPTRLEREGENGEAIIKDYPAMRGAELKIAPEAVTCAACPHSQWHNRSRDCQDGYRLFALMPDGSPRRIYVKGTSTKPARSYVQSFQGRAPLCAYYTTISSEFVTNDDGNAYYVLKFEKGAPVPANVINEVKSWLVTFGKQYDGQNDYSAAHGEDAPHREDPTGVIDVGGASAAEPELF